MSNSSSVPAKDTDILFLVWNDLILDKIVGDRHIRHPHYMFMGPRPQAASHVAMVEYTRNQPECVVVLTGEQLGFTDAEMQSFHTDIVAVNTSRRLLPRDWAAREPLWQRIYLMEETICLHLAAWHRRRHALEAFRHFG